MQYNFNNFPIENFYYLVYFLIILAMETLAFGTSRKQSNLQLEAERNTVMSLIQSGSDRISYSASVAGRTPVWNVNFSFI